MNIYYLTAIPVTRSKIFFEEFSEPVVIGKKYYLTKLPMIDQLDIHGLTIYCGDQFTVNPVFPNAVNVNGFTYTVLQIIDMAKMVMTIYSKEGELLFYRKPALELYNQLRRLEGQYNEITINGGRSYFQFVDVPATPLPMVVPLGVYFTDKRIVIK